MCSLEPEAVEDGSVQSAQSRRKRLSDWEVGLHMQWVSELTCVVGLSLENLQPQDEAHHFHWAQQGYRVHSSRCSFLY